MITWKQSKVYITLFLYIYIFYIYIEKELLKIFLYSRPGVSNIRPVDRIRPARWFNPAQTCREYTSDDVKKVHL